jgi:hypothetical protein
MKSLLSLGVLGMVLAGCGTSQNNSDPISAQSQGLLTYQLSSVDGINVPVEDSPLVKIESADLVSFQQEGDDCASAIVVSPEFDVLDSGMGSNECFISRPADSYHYILLNGLFAGVEETLVQTQDQLEFIDALGRRFLLLKP